MRKSRAVPLFVLPGLVAGLAALRVGAGQEARPATSSPAPAAKAGEPSMNEIMETFGKASTGNVADAVDEATGVRGFMTHDMKPVLKAKVIGRASTVLLRR